MTNQSTKEKRWELIIGLKKGLQELHSESPNDEILK